jgi:hypothetical protein
MSLSFNGTSTQQMSPVKVCARFYNRAKLSKNDEMVVGWMGVRVNNGTHWFGPEPYNHDLCMHPPDNPPPLLENSCFNKESAVLHESSKVRGWESIELLFFAFEMFMY